ncbi:MAG: YshB family small membrane protein [Candidatus Malihini olakiniferum]
MLNLFISAATHSTELGTVASYLPRTAIAIILCAELINFFI